MMRTLRAAYGVGRRDFAATVLSQAFILFLSGPIVPILLGAMFGGIGARVATQTEQDRVAIAASPAEFARLQSARQQVSEALPGRTVIELERVSPDDGRRLLEKPDGRFIAVMTGGLDQPRLTGDIQQKGSVAGEMRLILQTMNAQDGGTQLRVTTVEPPPDSTGGSRAITAQAGQMALFFLTIILAGMTLSQLIEEKSNKVIEVLAAAVPIESIFLGKLFAMLAASIVGIAVWVSVGIAIVSTLLPGAGDALPAPAVGGTAFLILSTVYFAMNYLLLGSVFLSIGGQASTAREVQVLSMPATVAQVLIFGLAALAVGWPDSNLAIAGAVFPLSSPLVMVARAAERPELWPHLVALLWQAIWIALIVTVSARLFRRTVLKSGPAPRRRWWSRAKA